MSPGGRRARDACVRQRRGRGRRRAEAGWAIRRVGREAPWQGAVRPPSSPVCRVRVGKHGRRGVCSDSGFVGTSFASTGNYQNCRAHLGGSMIPPLDPALRCGPSMWPLDIVAYWSRGLRRGNHGGMVDLEFRRRGTTIWWGCGGAIIGKERNRVLPLAQKGTAPGAVPSW